MVPQIFGSACFNTQSREGGCFDVAHSLPNVVRFNTQPHEGGCGLQAESQTTECRFQHTAARRRLLTGQLADDFAEHRFNTQPHEGGCFYLCS